jgi:hypothetical protein
MRILSALALLMVVSCRPASPKPLPAPGKWSLLDPGQTSSWQQAGIPGEGVISVQAGELTLPAGQPMTGARFANWNVTGMPDTNYAISYEAMRLEGGDIFGMCTFPVGSHQSHATFVIGGWGGTVTGISSIEFLDASENQTRGEQVFENNRWYRVRIEVRPDDIRAWVNDRPVVNASIKGKKVTLRHGDIDHCVPFGFASWNTRAKVRDVVVNVEH